MLNKTHSHYTINQPQSGIGALISINGKCTMFDLREKGQTGSPDHLREKRKVKGESPIEDRKEDTGTPKTHFVNFSILLSDSGVYFQMTKQILYTGMFLSIQQNTAVLYETYLYMIQEIFLEDPLYYKGVSLPQLLHINHFIPIFHSSDRFTLLEKDSQVPMTAFESNPVLPYLF